MKTFILKLDPVTLDELYDDISPDFLAFILVEAIFNLVQFDTPPTEMTPEDVLYHCDDPDSQFESSVELLLEILKRDSGEDVDGEALETCYNSEYYDMVATKLAHCMDSVRTANDFSELTAIGFLFQSPEYSSSFKFTSTHIKNQVIFCLSGGSEAPMDAALKDLLRPS